MADVVQLEEIAPKQTGGLMMVTPLAPPADLVAFPSSSARTETRREKRRREWHEGKIRSSREKKQHNQATTPEEQIGYRDPQPAGPVSPFASAQSPTYPATGGKRHQPSHGRTESQWKVIEELRLCAGCLTRTTPPHKPGDEHAPCTGQQNAPFDHAKMAVIRKALDKLKAEFRRSDSLGQPNTTSPQWNRQWRLRETSSNMSQHTLCQGIEPGCQYPEAGLSEYESGVAGLTYDIHPTPGGGFNLFAPLYNLHNTSSSPHPRVGFTTLNQGSASQAEGLAHLSSPANSHVVDAAGNRPSRAAASSSQSAELVAGMAPATPLISGRPGELIEEDLGTIEELTPRIAVMVDFQSSADVLRVNVENWDTLTRVSEGLPADLISSKDPIEKKMLHFGDRSWTMQGLYSPMVSFSALLVSVYR
jgi:hypothetical protein